MQKIDMIIHRNMQAPISKVLLKEDNSSMTHLEIKEVKDHVSVMVTSTATSKLRMSSTATTQASTSKMPKTFGVSTQIKTQSLIQISKVTFTKRGHNKAQKTGKMSKRKRPICSETLKRKQNGAVVDITPKKSRISLKKNLKVTCLDLRKIRTGRNSSMDSIINLPRIQKIRKILILLLPLIR